jgi:hypothetical protein
MKIRQLDSNGDWLFGSSLGNYLTNEAAIEQNIRTRCLEWVNDCYFALDRGIDWTNLLEHGQKNNLDRALRYILLASYGVINIESTNITFDSNRKFTFTYVINTIYSSGFQAQIGG